MGNNLGQIPVGGALGHPFDIPAAGGYKGIGSIYDPTAYYTWGLHYLISNTAGDAELTYGISAFAVANNLYALPHDFGVAGTITRVCQHFNAAAGRMWVAFYRSSSDGLAPTTRIADVELVSTGVADRPAPSAISVSVAAGERIWCGFNVNAAGAGGNMLLRRDIAGPPSLGLVYAEPAGVPSATDRSGQYGFDGALGYSEPPATWVLTTKRTPLVSSVIFAVLFKFTPS